MLSLQGGANLKASLEKSEPSRVQTWFSFSFPFHFLDSLGGRLDPKNSKTSRKHLICSISILQSLMLFPLLKQKKTIFDPLIDDQVQAPTFQGQVPKARTQTWDRMVVEEYNKKLQTQQGILTSSAAMRISIPVAVDGAWIRWS